MAADPQAPVRRRTRRDMSLAEDGALALDVPPSSRATSPQRVIGGGTEGNRHLTVTAGILLMVLFAALGVTILRIRALTSLHMFIGFLLIPPVALKMASTGYRFARYYTNNAAYRERGTPPALLRLIAPLVVLSTIAVFATGVGLLVAGPNAAGFLRPLHKASFVAWLGLMAIHVYEHLSELPHIFGAARGGGHTEYNDHAAGRAGRIISLTGVLVGGLVLAILLIPHFGPWVHAEHVLPSH